MSDAVIGFEASDLFALTSISSNFEPQNSGTTTTSNNVQTRTSDGDISCERQIFDITQYSQTYEYCGSDFVSDIGVFLTEFGDIRGGKFIDSITVNMTEGAKATIDVSGHNHSNNAHTLMDNLYDFSDFLPHEVGESFEAWDGFGVPDFGVTLGDDSSPSGATVTFSVEHNDRINADGLHLVGTSYGGTCSLSMSFSGIPTSNTEALIQADLRANTNSMLDPLVEGSTKNDSNSDFDTFSFEAHSSVMRI